LGRSTVNRGGVEPAPRRRTSSARLRLGGQLSFGRKKKTQKQTLAPKDIWNHGGSSLVVCGGKGSRSGEENQRVSFWDSPRKVKPGVKIGSFSKVVG